MALSILINHALLMQEHCKPTKSSSEWFCTVVSTGGFSSTVFFECCCLVGSSADINLSVKKLLCLPFKKKKHSMSATHIVRLELVDACSYHLDQERWCNKMKETKLSLDSFEYSWQ